MNISSLVKIFILGSFFCTSCSDIISYIKPERPHIEKLGTIDIGLVESTPIVFKNRLYRFEYIRAEYEGNTTGDSFMRFIDHETQEKTPMFGKRFHLGSAFVFNDSMYVTAVNSWGGDQIQIFVSHNLIDWKQRTALVLVHNTLFNTSLCKTDSNFVMMYEIGDPPEEAGVKYTARFAFSDDLVNWELTPPEYNHHLDRYSAPHALRYFDGYFYNFYLESLILWREYRTHVTRSSDLIHWEDSPLNPVLKPSAEDKQVSPGRFSDTERLRIGRAENVNNSDIDFCEFQGKLIINYSWGNQLGDEYLAEAEFDGTLEEFLIAWFTK